MMPPHTNERVLEQRNQGISVHSEQKELVGGLNGQQSSRPALLSCFNYGEIPCARKQHYSRS